MVDGDDPYAQSTFAGIADDDSDTEDIAITHAARHRLMNNSSTAGSANSVTSNLKARQQMLQRLKSTSAKDSMMEQCFFGRLLESWNCFPHWQQIAVDYYFAGGVMLLQHPLQVLRGSKQH